jgi:hypothetical protein
MITAFWLAIAAALVVACAAVLLRRPRRWAVRTTLRIGTAMSLRSHEDTKLAIQRIAAELASSRCSQEGNPDDEFYDDWYRWFTGDSAANVDYSRKQQRDQVRLGRGELGSG